MGRTAYIVWGRFNPPHDGHKSMINIMVKEAGNAPKYVWTSMTKNNGKNPYKHNMKVNLLKKIVAPANVKVQSGQDIFKMLEKLRTKQSNISKVVLYAGTDRANSYTKSFAKYDNPSNKHFNLYGGVNVREIPRNNNAPSATKVREALRDRKTNIVKKLTPYAIHKNINNLIKLIPR